MFRRLRSLALAASLMAMIAAPAAAGQAWVDTMTDVSTVLAVRLGADFPIASLMRADCDRVRFVQAANGGGVETLRCRLSDSPVMIPAFQGTPPETGFTAAFGPCIWTSDYWFARDGSIVLATSAHYAITPRGEINITARYAAGGAACG